MGFNMDEFINEIKMRDAYIEELKRCAFKDEDGFPNICVDRIWEIIDKLDDNMKNIILFWFITEYLTYINN